MVITVSCSACATSFPVDPNKIPEGGVNVRCSVCAHFFRVERPAPEPEPAPPPADDTWASEYEPFASDVETGGTEPDGSTSASAGVGADEEYELPDWATGLDAEGPEGATDSLEEAPDEPRPEPTGWTDPAPEGADWAEMEDESDPLPMMESDPLPVMEAKPVPETEPEPSPTPETVPGFSFGKRDPMDKARRLARVLVSDMVMYNSERHQVALSQGTLADDFADEIDKSWKEYVEQVGNEIADAEGQHFWSQALNDILARGAKVF